MLSAIGLVDQAIVDAGVEVVCLGERDLILEAKRLRAAVRGLWYRRVVDALGRILDDCPEGWTVVHFHQWKAEGAGQGSGLGSKAGHAEQGPHGDDLSHHTRGRSYFVFVQGGPRRPDVGGGRAWSKEENLVVSDWRPANFGGADTDQKNHAQHEGG
jgi:hypothetical protein